MATHLEHPRQESSTPQPQRTPYDETSNGEGRGEAVSGDDEVKGSEDKWNTSYGANERRRRREKAGDEATGDEEAQSTMNIDGHGQYTPNERDSPRTPPEPPPAFHPPPAPSSPNHPERPCNVDNTKSNKTPAQHRADAVHDPGGETRAPGNKPPSVWLEGESSKRSSPYVETDDVEMEDDNLKSSKTATQQRADVVHNPGGQTDAPDSVPPS
ncbi:hypothetical protein PAXINDRAFT_17493, partial [Paxillus involutus ATCC 200175]